MNRRLLEGGGGLAAGRVHHLVAVTHRLAVDAEDGAVDVQPVAGAQFPVEADVAVDGGRGAPFLLHVGAAHAHRLHQRQVGVAEAIEVIGDGEVLDHVALPRRHRAPVGLHPLTHGDSSLGQTAATMPDAGAPCPLPMAARYVRALPHASSPRPPADVATVFFAYIDAQVALTVCRTLGRFSVRISP